MLPRAAAALLGGFFLCNQVGEIPRPGFDANVLWLGFDLSRLRLLVTLLGALLLATAWRPPREGRRRILTVYVLVASGGLPWLVAGEWSIRKLLGKTVIGGPVPMAWVSGAVMLWLAWWVETFRTRGRAARSSLKRASSFLIALGIVAGSFLLAQLYLFSSISLPKRADCIVVMGSAVNQDGTPSRHLVDRTRTGCEMFRRGLSENVILSGGVTHGVSEPRAMAEFAAGLGVPPEALVLDEEGYSTYGSAESVRRIMRERGWRTALIVSHDYHLSRTWLAFHRAGIDAYTVPAVRSKFLLRHTLFQTFRESAAWVYYYFRPFWEPL